MQRLIIGLRCGVFSDPSRWCPRALARQDASSQIASTPALSRSAVGFFHLLFPNMSWTIQPYYCTAFQPVRMLGIGWAGQVLALKQPATSSSHPISSSQPRVAERLVLCASQNQPRRRLIRHPNRAFACVATKCIDTTKMDESSTKEVVTDTSEHVWSPFVFENSTHRDGAIYKNTLLSKEWFGFDFTDRNEITLEPYLDDPVFLQQGSLIEMTGPKRAIEMVSSILVEFDMRIKNGEQEEDDLQLIDGAMACNNVIPWKPIKHRITGKCGIVDMSFASIEHAVEATIEIAILEVQKCFSLSLSSYIYVMEDYEEIPLFHGTIDRSHGLTRFVVAVMLDTDMLLKFKVGNDVVRYRTFKAKQHGCASRRIKLDFASFVMKVTWSTI
ncbi:hypothetical protein HU200_007090 [Digitaria exilis]|uniref:DUF6598 domain-containing protein n=1 Tax=Digitaria exilis TaxID=1010633 RepID=A0A835KSU3_9POAL|nr:hypothetical protein HU200_007090 [Digitaria exilis]